MLDKYQRLLDECKKKGRAVAIYGWHEETLAKMKLNLYELKKKLPICRPITSKI